MATVKRSVEVNWQLPAQSIVSVKIMSGSSDKIKDDRLVDGMFRLNFGCIPMGFMLDL